MKQHVEEDDMIEMNGEWKVTMNRPEDFPCCSREKQTQNEKSAMKEGNDIRREEEDSKESKNFLDTLLMEAQRRKKIKLFF